LAIVAEDYAEIVRWVEEGSYGDSTGIAVARALAEWLGPRSPEGAVS